MVFNSRLCVEGYDDIHQNTSFDDCGKLCKEDFDCMAMAHSSENTCYIGYDMIKRNYVHAEQFKHANLYDDKHTICNKPYPLSNGVYSKHPGTQRKKYNMLFVCSQEDGENKTYMHNKNMTRIQDGQNLDFINIDDIDDYTAKSKHCT